MTIAYDSFVCSRITRRAFSLGALAFTASLSKASGRLVQGSRQWVVGVTDPPFAAKCDGETDDTAAIQAAIDDNKGGTIVIPGRALCAGVFLDGASYNGTKITCTGELVLKARPSVHASNFGGACVGLVFKDCADIVLQYRGDGNRRMQPDEEHCHLIGIAGAKNFQCPQFYGREVRGDGIYISQSDWGRVSTIPENLHFGAVRVINSEDDGRNAISIISGRNISIDSFVSVKVGGVVGGVRQPGGLDIEPNEAFQICEDITVNTAIVESAGVQCFGIYGKASGQPEDWIVRRVRVGMLHSINTSGVGGYASAFQCVDGLEVRGSVTHTTTETGVGLLVDNAKNVNVHMEIVHNWRGVILGPRGWVRNSKFDIQVNGYRSVGIITSGLTDTKVAGSIKGGEGLATIAVLAKSNGRDIQQQNVRYSVGFSRTSPMEAGYLNDPFDSVRFGGCSIEYSGPQGYRSALDANSGFGGGVKMVTPKGGL